MRFFGIDKKVSSLMVPYLTRHPQLTHHANMDSSSRESTTPSTPKMRLVERRKPYIAQVPETSDGLQPWEIIEARNRLWDIFRAQPDDKIALLGHTLLMEIRQHLQIKFLCHKNSVKFDTIREFLAKFFWGHVWNGNTELLLEYWTHLRGETGYDREVCLPLVNLALILLHVSLQVQRLITIRPEFWELALDLVSECHDSDGLSWKDFEQAGALIRSGDLIKVKFLSWMICHDICYNAAHREQYRRDCRAALRQVFQYFGTPSPRSLAQLEIVARELLHLTECQNPDACMSNLFDTPQTTLKLMWENALLATNNRRSKL